MLFKRRSKQLKEAQELIDDLSSMLAACQQAIEVCKNPSEYAELKRELVITYEERERQYNRLNQLSK
jgi:hypothetical protein